MHSRCVPAVEWGVRFESPRRDFASVKIGSNWASGGHEPCGSHNAHSQWQRFTKLQATVDLGEAYWNF
jgi:hypothetical protein